MTSRIGQWACSWVVPGAVLCAWEWLAKKGLVSAIVLPAPTDILAAAWAGVASGELLLDATASLSRVLAGFLVGAGIALPLGLLMGANRTLYGLLNPALQLLRPIPPIAYIPMAIVWFGIGNAPAVFLIAIGAFFPVLLSTTSGVQQVDRIYLLAAMNLGAGKLRLFKCVVLPAASPAILNGMRVGMGTSFIVVIVAEMIAVQNGLGFRILEAREYMWSAKILAGMFSIGILGLIIDMGFSALTCRLLRWHPGLTQK